MVKAGVYLIARMNPGFADAPPWRPTVVILGVLTMLLAGWRAVREYDLKLILAFGTVSQLGLITVMVGAGVLGYRKEGLKVIYRLKTVCILRFFSCISGVLKQQVKDSEKLLKAL